MTSVQNGTDAIALSSLPLPRNDTIESKDTSVASYNNLVAGLRRRILNLTPSWFSVM